MLTATDAPTLRRLMRALETVGVYATDDEGRCVNTAVGEQLRSDVRGSVAGWAIQVGRPYYWEAWSGLLDSVRTGGNAFVATHGTDVWDYRVQRPDEQADLRPGAMTATAGVVAEAVVASYDFARFGTLADIGGNVGTLLAAILARYPDVQGVLFDQPGVVANAEPVLHNRRCHEPLPGCRWQLLRVGTRGG